MQGQLQLDLHSSVPVCVVCGSAHMYI